MGVLVYWCIATDETNSFFNPIPNLSVSSLSISSS